MNILEWKVDVLEKLPTKSQILVLYSLVEARSDKSRCQIWIPISPGIVKTSLEELEKRGWIMQKNKHCSFCKALGKYHKVYVVTKKGLLAWNAIGKLLSRCLE